MAAFLELYHRQLLVFGFVLARVGGLVFVAPALAARSAPSHVRVLLTLAVAMLVAPVYWATPSSWPGNWLEVAVPLCREVVLGLLMGLALAAVIGGIQAAGHVVGQMSGMSVAEAADAELEASGPVFGRLYGLMATAVFLVIGGHRQSLAALLDTFRWMPPGRVGFSEGLVSTLSEVAGQSLLLALRVAAPVLLALIVTTLVLAFIGRALPQLSVFSLGLGLNSIVVVAMLAVSLGAAVWVLQDQINGAIAAVGSAISNDNGALMFRPNLPP
jgi:flagellar biosynthetic protein FliR